MKIEMDDNHVYRVDGKIYPSVTTVLASVSIPDFSMVDPDILRAAADRGTMIHKITEMIDLHGVGRYDLDSTQQKIVTLWRGCREAVEKNHGKISAEFIELKVFNSRCGYCGTVDRVYLTNRSLIVLDIKSGATAPGAPPQTAAYLEALPSNILTAKTVSGVRLRRYRYTAFIHPDNDTYKIEEHKSAIDFNIFLSALNIYKYKQENKIYGRTRNNYY